MNSVLFNDNPTPKLTDIIPFKDGANWYLKLIYKYVDEKGKHAIVIPKATLPFPQKGLPSITWMKHDISNDLIRRPYINCNDSMTLYKSDCVLAKARGVKDPYYYFDIITEFAPKPKEMTLDEIEKELGYKVKIINKDGVQK